MTSQFVEFEQDGSVLVGRVVPSKVTEREAAVIVEEVRAAAGPAHGNVALDLSNVALLASAGLAALLNINTACRGAGGRLAIFGVGEDVAGMMRITKLDRVLDLRPDRVAAIEGFR